MAKNLIAENRRLLRKVEELEKALRDQPESGEVGEAPEMNRLVPEETFRTLFENGLDGMLLTRPDGRIDAANPAACNMLGRNEEEIIQAGREGIFDAKDPMFPAGLEERARTSKIAGEFTFLRKDGTPFPIELSSKIYRDRKGELRAFVIFRDISERKLAVEKIRESEERYRAVVEDQTEFIARFTYDSTLTFVNDAACRFLGKSAEELIGKKWQSMVVEEDQPMTRTKLHTLSMENPVVSIENRLYSGSGQVRWVHFVNRGFFDSSGKLVEIQSVGRDITERKRLEEALQTASEFQGAVIDALSANIAVIDNSGKILAVNRAWRDFATSSSNSRPSTQRRRGKFSLERAASAWQ